MRILKIVELGLFDVSFLSKVGLLWEDCLIMEKGKVFESLINFSWNTFLYASTSELDLEIGN